MDERYELLEELKWEIDRLAENVLRIAKIIKRLGFEDRYNELVKVYFRAKHKIIDEINNAMVSRYTLFDPYYEYRSITRIVDDVVDLFKT